MIKDKTILITGATQGIGFESAKELAAKGATIIMSGRDKKRTEQAVEAVKKATGNDNVSYLIADFSSLAQVRSLADEFKKSHKKLDVLLNNAGGMTKERILTKDGFEMCWGLNHLSYFLLTNELMPLLEQAKKARIVNVASMAHARSFIDFDDLQGEKKYEMWKNYGQSKLANVMFTYALARRLKDSDITANCVHPGVVGTGFIANIGILEKFFAPLVKLVLISPAKGAKTSIYLASSPEVAGISGKYFAKSKEKRSSDLSYDEAVQEQLWEISTEQVKEFQS